MKTKDYCDRCKRIYEQVGAMIYLDLRVTRYTNLRRTLEKDYPTKPLNAAIAHSRPLVLCDDCYINFMDFQKVDQDLGKCSDMESPK